MPENTISKLPENIYQLPQKSFVFSQVLLTLFVLGFLAKAYWNIRYGGPNDLPPGFDYFMSGFFILVYVALMYVLGTYKTMKLVLNDKGIHLWSWGRLQKTMVWDEVAFVHETYNQRRLVLADITGKQKFQCSKAFQEYPHLKEAIKRYCTKPLNQYQFPLTRSASAGVLVTANAIVWLALGAFVILMGFVIWTWELGPILLGVFLGVIVGVLIFNRVRTVYSMEVNTEWAVLSTGNGKVSLGKEDIERITIEFNQSRKTPTYFFMLSLKNGKKYRFSEDMGPLDELQEIFDEFRGISEAQRTKPARIRGVLF